MYNQFQFHGKTHIPTDALNLINHMKLNGNGKKKEREKDREIKRRNKSPLRLQRTKKGAKAK